MKKSQLTRGCCLWIIQSEIFEITNRLIERSLILIIIRSEWCTLILWIQNKTGSRLVVAGKFLDHAKGYFIVRVREWSTRLYVKLSSRYFLLVLQARFTHLFSVFFTLFTFLIFLCRICFSGLIKIYPVCSQPISDGNYLYPIRTWVELVNAKFS